MDECTLPIDDAVADASPVLARARLDGLDCVSLPFAERYVQAWRGTPDPEMEADTLVNVLKVCGSSQAKVTPHAGHPR